MMTADAQRPPLTKSEAAVALRSSESTIDNYRRRGLLSCTKVGRRILIDRDSLDALLSGRASKSVAEAV